MNKYGIIAIHSGNIEPGTSEIARSLAGNSFNIYLNEDGPHVTSTKFHHSDLNKLLQSCEKIISVHGEKNNKESFVIVGGRDTELAQKIEDILFHVGFTERHYSHRLRGIEKENVCNRGLSGVGIQLEISRKLRDDLINDEKLLTLFSNSIKSVLQ